MSGIFFLRCPIAVYNSIKTDKKRLKKFFKKLLQKVLTNKKACAIMGKLSHERDKKVRDSGLNLENRIT